MDWLEISIIAARILIELIFFAIGASVFSFLNVIIYRVPRKLQFAWGKSICTTCGHDLFMKDMIPIISWILLKGKCRYCGAPISPRYTIVEALGGILAVLCTLFLGIGFKAAICFVLLCILVVVLFIGYEHIKKRIR